MNSFNAFLNDQPDNKIIYLDNAATEPVMSEVADKMYEILKNDYGNPSSLHNLGLKAENLVTQSREIIASTLGASKNEIYFAPSGTIANNTAIFGYLKRNKRAGKKVLISCVEHPSVYNIIKELKGMNYEVVEIPLKDSDYDYDFIERNVDENTALISAMAVNNETGTVFNIKKIRDIVSLKNPKTVIHCDCVQAYMKMPIKVRDFGADMITIAAHKIGGPKGVGALYVKQGLLIEPVYVGGGQEKGLFSQTEAVHNIYGFALSAKINKENNYMEKIKELYDIFVENLSDKIIINSKNNLPNIINISVPIRSEIALHKLEMKGIYVSSGSACSQKKGERNRVLAGFGLPQKLQDTALRISFGYANTKEEILIAVKEINSL